MAENGTYNVLTSHNRQVVLDAALQLIEAKYVFQSVGQQAIAAILEKVETKGYEGMHDPSAFADAVTHDLQAATGDAHLRLVYDPKRITKMNSLTPGRDVAELARRRNNGFSCINILRGNIGYVDIRHFFAPDLARETAAAAMQFLSQSDAIIVDLRHNTGGNPGMVQFVCSYFFPEETPVHLNTIRSRLPGQSTEYWSLDVIPGRRLPKTPLFVLTSGHTFSGGEEFAYNMKHLNRGTIVGETTAGGANPAGIDILTDSFYITVPHAAPINPITGTNWEGCGVIPHVETHADSALHIAHQIALEKLIEGNPDASAKTQLQWALEEVTASANPISIPAERLESYAGIYEDTSIVESGGELHLKRKFFTYRLMPLNESVFWLEGPAAGFESRVEFCQIARAVSTKLRSRYPDGREIIRARSAPAT